MCEVNVSCLLDDVDPFILSHSVAEAGEANKWSDALEVAAEHGLEISDVEGVKYYFAGFGAWDRDEIAGWTKQELDALVLQFAAGDLRELQSLCPGNGVGDIDWNEAEKLAEQGTVCGRIYASGESLFVSLCD